MNKPDNSRYYFSQDSTETKVRSPIFVILGVVIIAALATALYWNGKEESLRAPVKIDDSYSNANEQSAKKDQVAIDEKKTIEESQAQEKAQQVDREPIDYAVKSILPANTPASIVKDYADLYYDLVVQGEEVPSISFRLKPLLSIDFMGRIVQGWEQDGNPVHSAKEFRAYGGDWATLRSLKNMVPVFRKYKDWNVLRNYVYYRAKAKAPVGLAAYCADPKAFSEE